MSSVTSTELPPASPQAEKPEKLEKPEKPEKPATIPEVIPEAKRIQVSPARNKSPVPVSPVHVVEEKSLKSVSPKPVFPEEEKPEKPVVAKETTPSPEQHTVSVCVCMFVCVGVCVCVCVCGWVGRWVCVEVGVFCDVGDGIGCMDMVFCVCE